MTRTEMLHQMEADIAQAIANDDDKAVRVWRAHRQLMLDAWKRADVRTQKVLARKAMATAWMQHSHRVH